MAAVKVRERGQLTIPASFRKELHLTVRVYDVRREAIGHLEGYADEDHKLRHSYLTSPITTLICKCKRPLRKHWPDGNSNLS